MTCEFRRFAKYLEKYTGDYSETSNVSRQHSRHHIFLQRSPPLPEAYRGPSTVEEKQTSFGLLCKN